jgi:uncharacterized protein
VAEYEISFAPRFSEIDRAEWDELSAATGTPLMSWGFLALLEASGSMTPEAGWQGAHLLVRRGGRLVAAAPFYVKAHSWGEFVFDFGFAEAAESAGLAWYPKLVGVVPATPAPAWRVLCAPGEDRDALTALALGAAEDAARSAGLAGLHVLWPDEATAGILRGLSGRPLASARRPREAAGGGAASAGMASGAGSAGAARWTRWSHQAFLWTNPGCGDFAGYLDSFSKNMRRNVRREREAVAAAGISTRMIRAEEARARPRLLETMADFYESHNAKFGPWAAKFLTREFFTMLPDYLGEGWALAAAFAGGTATREAAACADGGPVAGRGAEGEPLALAFFLEGRDRLYGRFYGARREVPGLHFELCYYLPIEYALARGLGSFDPGMGSPHKARRGFRSIDAPSFHLCFEPRLASLMERVLPEANASEREEIEALNEELPFKLRPGAPEGE